MVFPWFFIGFFVCWEWISDLPSCSRPGIDRMHALWLGASEKTTGCDLGNFWELWLKNSSFEELWLDLLFGNFCLNSWFEEVWLSGIDMSLRIMAHFMQHQTNVASEMVVFRTRACLLKWPYLGGGHSPFFRHTHVSHLVFVYPIVYPIISLL